MASSSVPSSTLEMPQVRNDFLSISCGISLQDCFMQHRTRFLDGVLFFPAGVNVSAPRIIHDRYFLLIFSLEDLFRHLSKGCRTGVWPPWITIQAQETSFLVEIQYRNSSILSLFKKKKGVTASGARHVGLRIAQIQIPLDYSPKWKKTEVL